MAAVDLNVHPMAGQLADARVVAEDELLGLEIEQVRLLEQDGNRLLFELSVGLVEILDDFEMNGLVLHQHRLDLLQGLQRVDAEDLIEEVIVSIVEELQSLFVHFPQVWNMREVVAEKSAEDLYLRTLVLEVSVEEFLQLLIITEILQILIKLLREGVDLDAFDDLNEETIRQVSDGADELTAKRRVILQRIFEELYLRLYLLLPFEEAL